MKLPTNPCLSHLLRLPACLPSFSLTETKHIFPSQKPLQLPKFCVPMREDETVVMSSEDSSSPDDREALELGLGLSLGSRGGGGLKSQFMRILTAKDLPSVVVVSNNETTSSSSSTMSSCISGTKRIAASAVSPSIASSSNQVVGWPPIGTHRKNSRVNQGKSFATEEFNSMEGNHKSKDATLQKTEDGSKMRGGKPKHKSSLFVKVNMDGDPIGRKVDLSAHTCYGSLARTLEQMFLSPPASEPWSGTLENNSVKSAGRQSKFLDGVSEFVLTYEDKDGDWMLVGDVPWGMFLGSVKRLRIMRKSEATGFDRQT